MTHKEMGLYTQGTLLQAERNHLRAKRMAYSQLCFCGLAGSKPFIFICGRPQVDGWQQFTTRVFSPRMLFGIRQTERLGATVNSR